MVFELQYINPLQEEQHGYRQKSCKQRKEEPGRRDPSFIRTLTHTHLHTHTINDHAEDPESAFMRQQIIMNTVHLSLFPPHEIAHTHTHTVTHKRSTGEQHRFFGEYEEVECDSAVEGSEMRTGKV